MAVDVKTLRIGSHILVNGKRERVMAIDALNRKIGINAYKTDDNGVKHPFGYAIEQVEAVPITPELLKELGFENGRVGIWWHWWKDGFHLQHRDESEYWHFHGDIGLRYFHELESLYYMIYETELIQD